MQLVHFCLSQFRVCEKDIWILSYVFVFIQDWSDWSGYDVHSLMLHR